MNEEFENKFRRMCWNMHINADSYLDSQDYREFAKAFYELGLKHGKDKI